MKKQIISLTVAGLLAVPIMAAGGTQAQAASTNCKTAANDLLNTSQTKQANVQDLDKVLEKYGVKINFKDIQKQAEKQDGKDSSKTTQNNAKKPAAQTAKPKTDKNTEKQSTEAPKSETPTDKTEQGDTSKSESNQSSSNTLNAYEQKVVDLTNQERTKAGLKALKADNSTLSKMARAKSQDMRDNNYFDHQSPTYGSPFDMMKKFGISYKSAGENIAAGQKTPEEVVEGWMNSPGHRANILNASFTTIGVGYVDGGSYGSYWTQEFIGN